MMPLKQNEIGARSCLFGLILGKIRGPPKDLQKYKRMCHLKRN